MAPSAVSFFLAQEAERLAELIGKLKGEDEEGGPFVTDSRALLEKAKYEDIYTKFTAETKLLLTVDIKDLERVFNLLIALIVQANEITLPKLLKNITDPIVASESGDAHLKLKILSNLYNSLDSSDALRYNVLLAVIEVAAKNDELDLLIPQLAHVDNLLKGWNSSVEQKRALYQLVAKKLKEGGLDREAFDFSLRLLRTYEGGDAATLSGAYVSSIAAETVKEALRINTILNFEEVFGLAAVQALKKKQPKLFQLLQIFLDQTLKEYTAFAKSNKDFIKTEGLDENESIRKMRLLSLASLGSHHVDGEVPYSTIAEALDIKVGEVELWVIDGISSGLLDAKMDQLRKIVVVTRSSYRVFSDKQWDQLGDKIADWRNNLKEVLQVIANAKLLAASQEAAVVVEPAGLAAAGAH
ncbi:hypothetical protein HK101_003782 [Irineochytrium annulatum]|nr:hypothetical protein HK101_003782 [Irineochytrium annulatum]